MKLLIDLVRTHPWSMAGMLLCLIAAALAEGIGISALLPLVTLASGSAAAPGEPDRRSDLERWVAEAFHGVGVELTMESLLALIVVVFLARGVVAMLARRQIGYTIASLMTELRLRMLRALMATSWSYHVKQRIGTFSNAYSTEVRRSGKLFLEATMMVSLFIEGTIYLGVALAASWQVTLAAIGVGSFVLLVLGHFVRMGRKAGRKQTKLFTFMSQRLTDVLQGVKPLKAMNRESLVAPMLEEGTLKMERALRKEFYSREAIAALQEPLMIPFLALGVIAGVRWLDLQFSTVLVLGMVAVRAIGSMNKAQSRYQKIIVDISAYESLLETIESAEAAREELRGGEPPSLERAIELDRVCLRLGDRDVLQDVSLSIPAGSITAFSGPSGAGKTTIADLVAGLLTPDRGEIRVDGRPLPSLDMAAWRRRIGYVPQEMFLLHDTIEMNVSLGDPQVPRSEVERALRDAHAWEFVAQLPQGVETVVGERGSALSGGQRQRIAIARALIHRPLLLILDEATAALDPASEAIVWKAVEALRGRTTVLAVSHQPAIHEIADRAYRIADGKAEPVSAPGGTEVRPAASN